MMWDYRWKIAGMVIAGIGFLALIIQKLTHFTVFQKFNSDQHFNVLLWITLIGLLQIMVSKEKIEDERVQQIRTKALMFALFLVVASALAFAMTVTLMPTNDPEMANGVSFTPAEVIEAGRALMFYPAIGIVFYLLMFHIGLYFDNTWDYDNKSISLRVLWQNKGYRLAIKLVGALILFIIFKLME